MDQEKQSYCDEDQIVSENIYINTTNPIFNYLSNMVHNINIYGERGKFTNRLCYLNYTLKSIKTDTNINMDKLPINLMFYYNYCFCSNKSDYLSENNMINLPIFLKGIIFRSKFNINNQNINKYIYMPYLCTNSYIYDKYIIYHQKYIFESKQIFDIFDNLMYNLNYKFSYVLSSNYYLIKEELKNK